MYKGMGEGVYVIWKPKGPSSNGVLEELRRITGIGKIGHAGTLDPLAEGVLVVGIGRKGTKKLSNLVKSEKEYLAEIRLGIESTTDDEEGEKREVEVKDPPTIDAVRGAVSQFKGETLQTPPIYSAVKVKGQEAYKLARRGIKPNLKPRKVLIRELEILDYQWPILKLRAVTGSGVYIRALARDIGQELGTGGYLAELERTRVGPFSKADALTVGQFRERWA
jgi:tRNA pseudouridine55 synthase